MYHGMILKDDPCVEEKHLNNHSLSNGIISQDEKSPLVIIPGLKLTLNIMHRTRQSGDTSKMSHDFYLILLGLSRINSKMKPRKYYFNKSKLLLMFG